MTVREMIKVLKQAPPDAPVQVCFNDWNGVDTYNMVYVWYADVDDADYPSVHIEVAP